MAELWHNKPDTRSTLQTFHRRYARYPTPRIRKAKKRFTVYTNYLATKLRAQGMCSRIGYTGSVYQGVVVPYHSMDFDIVVIQPQDISRHLTPVKIPDSPGYCNLKLDLSSMDKETADQYRHLVDDKDNLLPVKSIDRFYGVVQKIVNDHGEMSQVVELVRSGPSVQLDTYRMGCLLMKKKKKKKKKKKYIMYSVDVVLAYEIEHADQKIVYVAKPPKTGSPQTSNAWRKSFSLTEKALFDGMDRDGGCRKMVLRILKAMLKNQAELEGLTSYNFKTALLHEVNVSYSSTTFIMSEIKPCQLLWHQPSHDISGVFCPRTYITYFAFKNVLQFFLV